MEPNQALIPIGRKSGQSLARDQYGEVSSGTYGYDPNDDPQSSGFLEYWHILCRHKYLWILFAFAGAVAGLLITIPETPIYQASASIEISSLNDNFLNLKQSSPVTDTDASYETSDLQTQIKILQSQSLLERVQNKLNAAMPLHAVEPGGHIAVWRKALNLPQPSPEKERTREFTYTANSLKVRAAGRTRIVEITADSPDPKIAAGFVNTLANEFIEQNLEARWKTTQKTSDWLSRQLEDMRFKLERSESSLQAYARNSGLLITDDKTSVSTDKLRQLQTELSTATADRITKQSRFEIAQSGPLDALPDVLNDAPTRDTQNKITDLKRQIADLTATYTPEYSKVKRLQAELATMQSAFDHDRGAILRRIKNDYNESLRREKLLTAAYTVQATQIAGEGERSIQYSILKREADSNRQIYESMLQQLKESTIASAMRASNIRVVDPPKIPATPYKPNAKNSGSLGLLAGIFIGAAFIILREQMDRTIQKPGDATFYLNLPELGIIPSAKIDKEGHPELVVSDSSYQMIELVTWRHKPSAIAESFRSTLFSILFAAENSVKPKVLMLTSAGPSEGKSTVASNLAVAIAEVGQRILLIDADLRRPRQHEIFNMENESGLSNLLRRRTELNGDISLGGLIRESAIPGLFVLTSGPPTSAATNLLYSSYFPEFLNYLRDQFDVVLIDTPPMLQIPDARIVGRSADKVIMVIRAGQTTRDAALAARQRFSEDGTEILGTILNDWDPKSSGAGHHTYYDYRSADRHAKHEEVSRS